MPNWPTRRLVRRLVARSNEDWIRGIEENDSRVIEDLRTILVAALMPVLRTRIPRQASSMAQDFAQEAMLLVLDRMATYRGEARFTSWCAKIAVRVALSELRKARWADVSLESVASAAILAEPKATSDQSTIEREISDLLHELIRTELTERQRTAIMAVMLAGMPIEVVSKRMAMNRNALYKLLYDARMKLKKALLDRNLALDDF